MKYLEQLRNKLDYYEGLLVASQNGIADEAGYFECAQTSDGTITICCHFSKDVHLSVTAGVLDCVLEGDAANGWHLMIGGDIFANSHRIRSSFLGPSTTLVMRPTSIRATRTPVLPDTVSEFLVTRFAFANLILIQSMGKPSPVILDHPEYQLSVTAVENYLEKSELLRTAPGIEYTANVEIRRKDGKRHSLNEAIELMNSLVYPLRLWCGNKLDWLNGSGLDDLHGTPLERAYKNGVINNFSNTLLALGWTVDLKSLSEAYFDRERTAEIGKLKDFIDYFVDVCARGTFLETKALAAATLLDALTLMHATKNENDLMLSEKDFRINVLPKLKAVIDSLDLHRSIREPMKQALQGVHRTSFRSRLRRITDDLDLGLDKQVEKIVIATRNKLVHQGKFPINKKVSSWAAYQCLLWTDYAILCRLSGYSAPLASPL